MSRAARLLDLMQALRRRRAPVAGETLARELGVSLRTLYRDIGTLRAQGAAIEGAAGLGYVFKPGFTLPPLMFNAGEIDALALGLRWVAAQGDPQLEAAARDALAKIAAVLPDDGEEALSASPLKTARLRKTQGVAMVPTLREALATRRKVELDYADAKGRATRRLVWPVAIGFFEEMLMLAAWCELRDEFRHFRLDRIAAARIVEARIPARHAALLRDWERRDLERRDLERRDLERRDPERRDAADRN